MKIRLMGSHDLVVAWKTAMEQSFGVAGHLYPCHRGTEWRVYFDLDDRIAEQAVEEASRSLKATAVTRKPKPKTKALKGGQSE